MDSRNARVFDKVPDELLDMILSYTFFQPPGFSRQEHGLSKAHLVSKRWLRVGLPIFYRSTPVTIYAHSHTERLVEVFKKYQDLGLRVRSLVIFGGFGICLPLALDYMRNVETLHLSFQDIYTDPQFSGTARALGAMTHVKHFWYGESWCGNNRDVVREAIGIAQVIRTKWKSLESVMYKTGNPYDGHTGAPPRLRRPPFYISTQADRYIYSAILELKSLRTVIFDHEVRDKFEPVVERFVVSVRNEMRNYLTRLNTLEEIVFQVRIANNDVKVALLRQIKKIIVPELVMADKRLGEGHWKKIRVDICPWNYTSSDIFQPYPI